MSFTVTGVENTIRAWAQQLSGIPFFHAMDNTAKQNGLAPNGTYGTVRLIDATIQGIASEQFTDIDVVGEPRIDHLLTDKRLVTISLQAYRTGARDTLSTLQIAAYSDTSTQLLQGGDIGLVRFSILRDITEVINGNFEERAQMDLMLNVVGNFNEILYVIETVPIEGLTFDQNFEVTDNG